jgi:hypothetical protein
MKKLSTTKSEFIERKAFGCRYISSKVNKTMNSYTVIRLKIICALNFESMLTDTSLKSSFFSILENHNNYKHGCSERDFQAVGTTGWTMSHGVTPRSSISGPSRIFFLSQVIFSKIIKRICPPLLYATSYK